jgi:superfamily II DNA or RNA helicase
MTTATFAITQNQNHPAIEQALAYMAAHDTDHATTQNGVGFNGRDTEFGCSLAKQASARRLSDKQHELACKMLWRYNNTQIAPAGIQLPVLGDLQEWLRERERLHPYKPTVTILPPTTLSSMGRVYLQDNQLTVQMPKDYWTWVPKIKTIEVQGHTVAKYNGTTKLWQLPLDWLDALQQVLPTTHFDYTPEVLASKAEQEKRRKLAALELEIRKEAQQARINKLLRVARLDEPLANGWLLQQHQKEAVQFVFEHERVIIGDQMGLGKTLSALKAAAAYQQAFGCDIICLVPVTLIDNWYKEAAYVGCTIKAMGQTAGRIPKPQDITKKFVLIVDECHAFKNMGSQRTKAYMALTESPHLVANICMSGTPVKNGSPSDIYPILKSLKHPIAENKKRFFDRYGSASEGYLRELHQILTVEQPVMIRRTKEEVLDLPMFTRQMVEGVLTPYAQSIYDAKFKALQVEYNRRVAEDEISSTGWELVMLNHLRHAGSVAKIDTVVNLALEFLQGVDGLAGEQVVIFTVFKDTAFEIQQRLQAQGFVVDVLSGDTKQSDRDPMVQRFQTKQTDAIVCMSQAGGVGITLTSASKVIMADRDWNLHSQCESRVDRLGQTKPTTAYWVRYTICDSWIDNKLIEKENTSDLILQGYSTGIEGVNWSEEARNLLAAIFNGEYKLPQPDMTDYELEEDEF